MTDASLWHFDTAGHGLVVPVAKPLLPTADAIMPYLREIDVNRFYSNGGPLNQKLQERLCAHYGARHVVCGANATLGLVLALMAQKVPKGSLCLIPAWTFAASAHAAVLAGLVPWLVDVDPDTHQLMPGAARSLLRCAPGPIGAVMPVMPFGSPMDAAAWDSFRAETSVAVVIDAAAGFDTLKPSRVPAVVSLHATKVLGVGEGCFIASDDAPLIDEIVKAANFGFWLSREAVTPGANGKLSEYGAAVGLAALENWPRTRAAFMRVGQTYRRLLQSTEDVRLQTGFGEAWVSSTLVASVPEGSMAHMTEVLKCAGIGTRRWWGGGLHHHKAFAAFPRTALPVTDRLVETQIGLPCWPDLPDDKISDICSILAKNI